ncbi:MAG: hypothetical protein PHE68_06175 [Candidatus Peribacteraceae bacterium]|nr:hypothetical protein [Candidatus Peribacteraceae bacterium]
MSFLDQYLDELLDTPIPLKSIHSFVDSPTTSEAGKNDPLAEIFSQLLPDAQEVLANRNQNIRDIAGWFRTQFGEVFTIRQIDWGLLRKRYGDRSVIGICYEVTQAIASIFVEKLSRNDPAALNLISHEANEDQKELPPDLQSENPDLGLYVSSFISKRIYPL